MLLPGMRSTIFGFNFLLGVLSATIIKSFLSLKAVPKPDDTADALALAVCHGHYSGSMYSKICLEAKK